MTSAPWVATFNSLGLEPAILAPYEADHFLELARRRTGLDDYGSPEVLEPLQHVLHTIRDSEMSLLGRMIKLEEVLRYLSGRLQIEEEIRRHPEILDEEVVKPIFIVSLPRAGSSILFELMSQRSGIRSTLFWEAIEPAPAPDPATYDTDPRIRSTEEWIDSWNQICPEFPSRHLVGPTVPVECLTTMGFSFVSHQFGYGVAPEAYSPHVTHEQWVQSYEYYKRVLKLLQWKFADKQWLFKSPAHLYNLPELLEVFPDARIVFIHRDPITTAASTASVMDNVHGDIFGMPFDPDAYLKDQYLDQMRGALGYMMALYDKAVADGATIVNVLYRDLMADPVGEVTRIYEETGIGMSAADQAAVADHLANRPKGKYGAHTYRLPTEIDLDAFRATMATYMDKFGVPEEGQP
jgi:hypothetical protein